jgi:hypothetical protein
MKKVVYLGVILVLLAVIAVPAMAKTPGNGNSAGKGNGNGKAPSAAQGNSTSVNPVAQGRGNQANRLNKHNTENKANGNHGNTHPNTPFYLQGTITAVVTETQSITVTLTHGNAMVKQFIGLGLTIKVTDATQIFKITQGADGGSVGEESSTPALSSDEDSGSSESETNDEGDSNRVAIPFSQLAVGQYVAIHGNLVNGVYTARLITVYIREPVGESAGDQP